MREKTPSRETPPPEDIASETAEIKPSPNHICFYADRLVWSAWERFGDLSERRARRVPICTVCGRERPAIRPRPPVRREARAEVPVAPPLADEAGRTVATLLVRRGHGGSKEIAAPGFFSTLARRGVPAGVAEEWLDHFLRAGWIQGRWLVGRGGNRLDTLILRNAQALLELAHPGSDARRRAALAAAREKVASLSHPKALEVASYLFGEDADRLSPRIATALAAVAVHVEASGGLPPAAAARRRVPRERSGTNA